jgi:hypothetical protein
MLKNIASLLQKEIKLQGTNSNNSFFKNLPKHEQNSVSVSKKRNTTFVTISSPMVAIRMLSTNAPFPELDQTKPLSEQREDYYKILDYRFEVEKNSSKVRQRIPRYDGRAWMRETENVKVTLVPYIIFILAAFIAWRFYLSYDNWGSNVWDQAIVHSELDAYAKTVHDRVQAIMDKDKKGDE